MKAVRQNLGLDEQDTTMDNRINSMSHDEILDCVTEWEGLIHYGPTIKQWIQDIYHVKLS
jgi:hypothetical protein